MPPTGQSTTAAPTVVGSSSPVAPREFWLRGGAVLCACPDCGAPMSIRLWLMVADCWQCGTSVELTEQQEREIQVLLRRHDDAETQLSTPRSAPDGPRRQKSPGPDSSAPLPSRSTDAAPADTYWLPAAADVGTQAVRAHQTSPRRLGDWLQHMPAWLVSLLFHMALLALLALLMLEGDVEDPYITLSTEVRRWIREGDEIRVQNPDDEFHFDLPLPNNDLPRTPRQLQAVLRADQDARELRLDPRAAAPQLPALDRVKRMLRSDDPTRRTLAARDPRVRVDMVINEGGTTLTEAAVARGLRWMAEHQNADGSWSLHRFHKVSACRGRCDGQGHVRSDSAATSLCLLPFLGAGQTHHSGIYQDTVSQGLRWLLQHQKENGDLRADSRGNTGMYAHGQGAIVLCEAYAITRDEQLREAAQNAIDFIARAQHIRGGWRYAPGEPGDTSVFGWQLMALQSARVAELNVPPETFELANVYLDSTQYDEGSRYAYQPGRGPTHVMTAEALLCRIYLGWNKEYPGLQQGVKYLTQEHLPGRRKANFYYWYYATQVLHHYGGKPWRKWNLRMRDILVESQEKRGHTAGSWEPRGGHASQGGRLYTTALAVCTLEVYYRHTPIFRQIDLD